MCDSVEMVKTCATFQTGPPYENEDPIILFVARTQFCEVGEPNLYVNSGGMLATPGLMIKVD